MAKLTDNQKIIALTELLRCAVFLLWNEWEDNPNRRELTPRQWKDGSPMIWPENILACDVIDLAHDGITDYECVTEGNYRTFCDYMEEVGHVY